MPDSKRVGLREYVEAQVCAVCGRWPVDFDHQPTRGSRGNIDHDLGCPLCREHHAEKGQLGVRGFEAKYELNLDQIINGLIQSYVKLVRSGGIIHVHRS